MELEDVQRRVQFRQGSYTVTIPLQIVHALGIHKNQYVRFAVSKNNKIVIKPVESNITKKDMAEADRDSAALDEYGQPEDGDGGNGDGDGGYMGELAEALGRKPDAGEPSRIEKLRMR